MYEEKQEINQFKINNDKKNLKIKPFLFEQALTFSKNNDIIQINYNYIASTRSRDILCIYSIQTKQNIALIEVNTSKADKVISMLTKDILCVGGGDTISLISIKDFNTILVSVIKPRFKISEICVMNNSNILICMSNNIEEYLFQYKYNSEKDIISNKIKHYINKINSELITKRKSNLTMASINKNQFITIIEESIIQLREINNSEIDHKIKKI